MADAVVSLSKNLHRDDPEPSELDDLTHAEMRLLYREASDTTRFAKVQQWKTLGAALILLGAIVTLKGYYPRAELLGHVLLFASIAVSAGAIYALAIYQAWQSTERSKLRHISTGFSGLARNVRGMKSRREANFFRYVLLTFMITGVVLGEVIVFLILTGMGR